MQTIQKIATIVFICASLAFGVIGITLIFLTGGSDGDNSQLGNLLSRLLATTVFIILPSFALSVAGKYLKN